MPERSRLDTERLEQPARWLRDSPIAQAEQVHDAIATEIDALLAVPSSGLVEGEGVEPRLCQRWSSTIVQPVYVIEDDAERLHEPFARRASDARFLSLSHAEQTAVVEMNRLHGSWLRDGAEGYGQAWIPSQPGATLVERLLAAIGTATLSD